MSSSPQQIENEQLDPATALHVKITRDLTEYYKSLARDYDKMNDSPDFKRQLALVMSRVFPYFSGKTVIDVGCGTGYWTQTISSMAQKVSAIDNCPEMVSRARARMYPRHVHVMQDNAYTLKTIAAKHSAAYVGFFWQHIPADMHVTFLRNLHAKLLPNSPVVILDFATPQADEIFTRLGNDSFVRKIIGDGSSLQVIRNIPEEIDLLTAVKGMAHNVSYSRHGNLFLFTYYTGGLR